MVPWDSRGQHFFFITPGARRRSRGMSYLPLSLMNRAIKLSLLFQTLNALFLKDLFSYCSGNMYIHHSTALQWKLTFMTLAQPRSCLVPGWETALLYFVVDPANATILFEPPRDKTNKMVCSPSEDSDQPGRPLSA